MEASLEQDFLKAALDDAMVRQAPHMRQFRLNYFFLVLIFDGKLKRWQKGIVTDANELLCRTALRSRQYFNDRLVSVIQKDHFEEWLGVFKTDFERLVQKIKDSHEKLDRQVDLLLRERRPPLV